MTKLALNLRPLLAGDSHHLLNLDNKVSEFPWDVEDWQLLQKFFPEWEVSVVTLNETPKGFSVIELSADEGVCRIHKLVAQPNGVGLLNVLMDRIEYRAFIKQLDVIELIVSETECRGGDDPYDKTKWMRQQGFKCEDIQTGLFEAYGNQYDGYVFHKSLHEGKYV